MRSAPCLLVSLVGVVLVSAVPPACAGLCQKKSGAVVFRNACKRRETALSLPDLGAKGDPGPGVRIIDSDGRPVGPVLDTGVDVAIQAQDRTLRVLVDRTGFPASGSFDHPSADCSGARYLQTASPFLATATVLGGVAYYPANDTQQLAINSFEYPSSPQGTCDSGDPSLVGGTCCHASSQGTRDESTVLTFDLSTLGLSAPFSLQLVP
jgi:hypothetical protein